MSLTLAQDRGAKRAEKGKGKSSSAVKRKNAVPAPDAGGVSKETSGGGGDATPVGDGTADDGALERHTDTAVGADDVGQRWGFLYGTV